MATIFTTTVSAQYYSWGADAPGSKWRTMQRENVRILYPDTAAAYATRTLWSIEQIQPSISYGFRHPALKIPFVIHPENFRSNGLVMWLPKRVEFLSTPATESYAMPWYKQLSIHEYRHAVQYNNLNRGVIRVLSYLLGEQGSTIGLLFLPIWLIEGDATLAETQMATFGRGLQPSFTMPYRALGEEMLERRNPDKWFCGSYLDFVPDHYRIGYQIASYSDNYYQENIWDKVAWYGVRNPYLFATISIALHKFYDTSVTKLYRATFRDLNDFWNTLPEITPSATPLKTLPMRNFTHYQWPVRVSDTTFVALRTTLNRPARLMLFDSRTGEERKLPYTGTLSSRPAIGNDGRLWWSEYRRSLLFEQRVNSRLCYMDLSTQKIHTVGRIRNALYPTPSEEGIAWIEYLPNGLYTLVIQEGAQTRRLEIPYFKEVHGLAWENQRNQFYLLITDDDGMYIATFDQSGAFHRVTSPSYATLSGLRARNGILYFGSIRSGLDEAHAYELESGREYRLTTSRYGSFDPEPLNDSTLLVTDYNRRGYAPALQRYNHDHPVAYAPIPENRVNPPRRKWDVVNMDSLRFTSADSIQVAQQAPSRKYRKGLHLFDVHSWMPVSLNPFNLVEEHHVAINWGVTAMSQNLLSNTEAYVSWGWNRHEGSLFNLGVRYFGLGPTLDVSASYGGDQQIYSLAQRNPETHKMEFQKSPSPDKYYAFSASLALPLVFEQGYHIRQLTTAVGWSYSNGLVANLGEIRFDHMTGAISNIERIGFQKGLHKLAFSIGFSDQVRRAHRDFAPRWGYLVQADYALNPANDSFSNLVSLYGKLFLPGITRPHSLTLAANYQTSFGGFKSPNGTQILSYRSNRLIPRSYSASQITSDHYTALSLNYQLPLWYPEGGISSVIYFKRIRLNLGVDWAQYRYADQWQRLHAYGGDILLDVNIFRQPDSATSTLTLSFYQSKHNKFWIGAGLGLPF